MTAPRLHDTLQRHVDADAGPGLVWAVDRGGDVGENDVEVGSIGTGVARDTIFRISSMTKPVTAVATLLLVEDGRLGLDDPVDDLLPELADRQVLTKPDGPLDETVPAQRPITTRDLLTFRFGLGMDFAATTEQATLAAMAELELGSGAPAPAGPPAPDEWIRRLGTLPLERQPGERWLYHTSADVLGVLVARAAGQSFDTFLRGQLFEPLGMVDTGFSVPAASIDRLGPLYLHLPGEARQVYDPTDGQWSQPPAFPSGGHGLVSTIDDYLAFARLLRAGGVHDGTRVLSAESIDAMTTAHVAAGPDPTGSQGWGFGVGVQARRHDGSPRSVGTYGWDGGLGSSWANDPALGLIGILLSDHMWSSPTTPPVFDAFWAEAYATAA